MHYEQIYFIVTLHTRILIDKVVSYNSSDFQFCQQKYRRALNTSYFILSLTHFACSANLESHPLLVNLTDILKIG